MRVAVREPGGTDGHRRPSVRGATARRRGRHRKRSDRRPTVGHAPGPGALLRRRGSVGGPRGLRPQPGRSRGGGRDDRPAPGERRHRPCVRSRPICSTSDRSARGAGRHGAGGHPAGRRLARRVRGPRDAAIAAARRSPRWCASSKWSRGPRRRRRPWCPNGSPPTVILSGDLARRFVSSLGSPATDRLPGARRAADQATLGVWPKVSRLLAQPLGRPAVRAYHALRGLALFAAERYDESAAALEAALAVEPESAPAAFILGWVRSSAGKHARGGYRVAECDPASIRTMIPAYLALAEAYAQAGKSGVGPLVLKDGVRRYPASPELRNRSWRR